MPKELVIPTNHEELQSMLTDRTVMRELASGDQLGDFIQNYVNASLEKDKGIFAQVSEQTEAFMIKWLRENNGGAMDATVARRLNLDNPNARGKIRPNTIYNKSAVGAKHDGMFNTINDFFYSISDHSHKDAELSRKLGSLKNDLSSIKPSDGGFLIPEILRAELLRVAMETAIVRPRARVIPMDSLTVPFPTVDATSNVSSVFGGIVGYWTEEGATLTESQPRFGRVELRANKLCLYTEVPNELIRDAQPSMAAFLDGVFPEALAWFEDVGFFVGGGVGEPLGFLNAPASIAITRTGSGQNIDWTDIANMYSRMLPQSLDRAVWIVGPDSLPNLLTMPFAVGGTTTPMLLGGAGFPQGTSANPMTILGAPVIVSEKAAANNTSGDINFVDFGFYLLGDRQALSARQSEDFRFQNDLTAFRVIERVDGRPWLASAITPQNGGATLSPFVKLA